MDASKDYYRILDVSRDATPADIKKAYRKLARKYHPDVSKEADAETRFKEINEANEVLGEPKKRQEYDQQRAFGSAGGRRPGFGGGRAAGPRPGAPGGFGGGFEWGGPEGGAADWTSVFRQSGGRPFAMRGDDIEATVGITLDQALHGAEQVLNLPNGSTRRVRIPPGARPGGRLRLRGQGESGVGEGAPGDLLLTIRLAPQDVYRVEGADLHRDIPITPWEAALGGDIEVPTPFGRLRIKVPAGTQSGRVLRVSGKGFPGKQPGDLLLRLMIHVPPETEAGDWYRQQAETSTFDPRAGLH